MKKFSFPLDRVLAWRRTQQRLEEMTMERIHMELLALDNQRAALDTEWDALRLLPAPGGFTSLELAARDQFRLHLTAEKSRLAEARRAVELRLSKQMETLTIKRRDVLLLEKVRKRRADEWTRQLANELDLQAAESALNRWTRVQ
jgi:hypothetical protein